MIHAVLVAILLLGLTPPSFSQDYTNVPSAACMNKSTDTRDMLVPQTGTLTTVERGFKLKSHGWVEVGAQRTGAGLYPVPWCSLAIYGGGCGHYFCSEHIFDVFIPPVKVVGSPQLMGNDVQSQAPLKWGESYSTYTWFQNYGYFDPETGTYPGQWMSWSFGSNMRPGTAFTSTPMPEKCYTCPFGAVSSHAAAGGDKGGTRGPSLGNGFGAVIWGGQ